MIIEFSEEEVAFIRERADSDIALAKLLIKNPPNVEGAKTAIRYVVMWLKVKRALERAK